MCLSPRSMSSLPGRAALSLCRRTAAATAGGANLLAGHPTAHPAAGLAASAQAVRVCHSGPSSKSSVKTKKRGYDIIRNPQLNKVRARTLALIGQNSDIPTAGSGMRTAHFHLHLQLSPYWLCYLLEFWRLF